MKILKSIIYILLIFCMTISFISCGKKGEVINENSNTLETESTTQNKITKYTIGNLTVINIKDILDKTSLNDELKLELTNDKTNDQFCSIEYSIKDKSGKKMATVFANSDLENKASSFSITWDYNNSTANENEVLVKATEILIISVWPDYSEEYMEYVVKTVAFKTSFLNAFRNENTAYTANAVSGFISAGISAGKVTYTISYANLVENV